MFHLHRWLLPAQKLLRVFRNWDFCLFSFPPFRWSGVEGGVSGCTWYCVPGASSPPAGSRSSERGGSASGLSSVARSRFAGSFGSWRRGSCSVAAVFFVPATLFGCLSPFLTARSTTWGIVGDFGGSLPCFILSWFPIFGLWCTVG